MVEWGESYREDRTCQTASHTVHTHAESQSRVRPAGIEVSKVSNKVVSKTWQAVPCMGVESVPQVTEDSLVNVIFQ